LSDPTAEPRLNRTAGIVLVVAIFLLAICGLVYELIAGTLSSYLLGDSVTQFSLVIGIFLTAMGVGSYFSQHIRGNLLTWLVGVELAVGVIGGSTALIGFATFSYTDIYEPVLLVLISAVGVLVGLEIPLVIRILRDLSALRVTLANVLSADYLGALAASVLFPFALLPEFGLVRAGLVIGLANVAVAGLILWRIGPRQPPWRRRLAVSVALAAILLGGAAVASGRLVAHFENRIYQDEIIFAETTAHQRMVLTRWREDVRLYLNGHLQFSSVDEYRYHEALVHPAMIAADRRANVLILGGGDGLAARQVLAYPEVERIEIVDIDARVTGLFRSHRLLTALNGNALNDPRVRVHNTDAFRFLQESDALYDVILIDLPDPSAPELGKLYSTAFYGLAGRRLAAGGMLAAQCTSPFRARSAYWCIVHTLRAARWGPQDDQRFVARPYHTLVPTFGTWGFVLAGRAVPQPATLAVTAPTRYLTTELLPTLFVFPPDMAEVPTPINRLDDPVVSRLYRAGYHQYLD
jgi:spermidine synthase